MKGQKFEGVMCEIPSGAVRSTTAWYGFLGGRKSDPWLLRCHVNSNHGIISIIPKNTGNDITDTCIAFG